MSPCWQCTEENENKLLTQVPHVWKVAVEIQSINLAFMENPRAETHTNYYIYKLVIQTVEKRQLWQTD